MARDFKLIVNNPDQRENIIDVFGTNIVFISSFYPQKASLPGLGERMVYMLDLKEITPEQRWKLAANIAGRFGYRVEEVERDLDVIGCPVLAEGNTVVIENPVRWLT